MTPLEWQQKAAREVGNSILSAVYELRLPIAAQGGTLTLSASGDESDALAFNASADEIAEALGALSAVGDGGANVSGPKKGPFFIEIAGDNAGQPLPEGWLLADGSNLDPPATPTLILRQNGATTSLETQAATLWNHYTGLPDFERFLKVKLDLARAELGKAAVSVDYRDGDAEAKESQRSLNLRAIIADTQRDLDTLLDQRAQGSHGQTRTGLIARGVAVRNDMALSRNPYQR